MQVGTLAVQHIFEKDVHYRVPLYQRPYVWNAEEQWAPLWEDLRTLAESVVDNRPIKAHFLGASVQEQVDVPPGHIETRLLIDGQQRLTTLQLLLKAFQHVVTARGAEMYQRALTKLVDNDHPLSTDEAETFKVWPTNANRADFEAVMSAWSFEEVKSNLNMSARQKSAGTTIADGYFYFHSVISKWLEEVEQGEETAHIASLYSTLRDNVRLVVIDLDDKDDAQMIFETLNARGTPLLAADLVKNSLLSEFGDQQAAEKAYNKHWIAFDQETDFWRAEIGRGHARRARLELFLRHVLSILIRDDVAAAHLYDAYRRYAGGPNAGSPLDQMERIDRYGRLYKRMIRGWGNAEIDLYLERISVMDYETVYPLLLVLFEKLENDAAKLRLAASMVDSFLVRRLVCRLNTRGYGRLFVDIAADISEAEDPIQALQSRLARGVAEVDRWPSDEEFKAAWLGNPLYENLTRPRLRMLLEEMERASRTNLAESQDVARRLTVEHILPQTWNPRWPLPGHKPEPQEAEERNRLIHTMGNLTLLNDKLNPLQSNNAWQDTDTPGKRSGLHDHSTLYLNKALTARERWNEAAILERGEELFGHARKAWLPPAAALTLADKA